MKRWFFVLALISLAGAASAQALPDGNDWVTWSPEMKSTAVLLTIGGADFLVEISKGMEVGRSVLYAYGVRLHNYGIYDKVPRLIEGVEAFYSIPGNRKYTIARALALVYPSL